MQVSGTGRYPPPPAPRGPTGSPGQGAGEGGGRGKMRTYEYVAIVSVKSSPTSGFFVDEKKAWMVSIVNHGLNPSHAKQHFRLRKAGSTPQIQWELWTKTILFFWDDLEFYKRKLF